MELALIAEGTSDRILIPPVKWLCEDIDSSQSYNIEFIGLENITPKPDLSTKIEIVLRQNRHQMLLVHRDQDKMTRDNRLDEIKEVVKTARKKPNTNNVMEYIPVIPVKMTEAWLLIDEAAIKTAAGYPRNRASLELPTPGRLEHIADPKCLLHEKIRDASGLSGRKRKKLNPHAMVHDLAYTIDDYSLLNDVPAFRALRDDLARIIET